jgi:tetratricopeptide (TPR) repeat protein
MIRTFLTLAAAAYVMTGIAVGQEQAAQDDAAMQQAGRLEDAHQLNKASEVLSNLLLREPGKKAALLELGQVQLKQGLYEDAMKSFEAVLAGEVGSASARDGEVAAAESAALADRKAGIDGSALLCLVRARKFVPDSPRLLLDFGIQAEQMRIYKDADDALSKAHELAPGDARVLYALAHVQFDEQKMPEAEANLRAYLKMQPDDATAHYGLGRLLHMVDRDDEAKSELERSIALAPRQSDSYYELGEIALAQNQDGEAMNAYEKVLTVAPHHGGALTGMGELALRAKDYSNAEKYLKDATLYAPDYPRAHHYYALLLVRTGRQNEAQREAKLAAKLDQDESKARRGNFLTVIH